MSIDHDDGHEHDHGEHGHDHTHEPHHGDHEHDHGSSASTMDNHDHAIAQLPTPHSPFPILPSPRSPAPTPPSPGWR